MVDEVLANNEVSKTTFCSGTAGSGTRLLLEHLLPAGQNGQIAFAQTLGRKLDGRERILDLVGNAAGHFLPGGEPLGLFQTGEIVEHDDKACGLTALIHHAGHVDLQTSIVSAISESTALISSNEYISYLLSRVIF